MPSLFRTAVRSLPPALSTRLVIALANRPIRPPAAESEQVLLGAATRLAHGPQGQLAAWSWGTGPLVILLHGWGGRAAQLAPLAVEIATRGYRAVAPDITAHGESPGRSATWSFFVRDLAALAAQLAEPIHGLVGHSAGGLAMMAARRNGLVRANRFVCIASPSCPYPPVRAVEQRLAPSEAVLERYRSYLAAQLGSDWARLDAGDAFHGAGRNLLLVYDHRDRFVDHSQADRIAAAAAGATVLKTDGYSHSRVLAAPETLQAVAGFLAQSSA